MELHGQEAEVALLGALVAHLESPALIDVGAERGGFASALLAQGYGPALLIEPAAGNAEVLRTEFTDRHDVTVLELAVGADDGESAIYLAEASDGTPMPAFNRIGAPGVEGAIRWREAGTVQRRSLESLVAEGLVPSRVGLLKVDAEGSDLEVVAGLGDLECEALMVEHWLDLPDSSGACPWTLDDLLELTAPRGLTSMIYVHHRGDEVRAVFDGADPAPGDYGNLVFVSERLRERADAALRLVGGGMETLADARRALREKERLVVAIDREAKMRLAQGEELRAANADAERRAVELAAAKEEAERRAAELAAAKAESERRVAELDAAKQDDESYIADLRGRINELEEGVVIGGAVGRALGRRWLPPLSVQTRTRIRVRLRYWIHPRLGMLTQHAPTPLQVPRRQLRLRPPVQPPGIAIVTPSFNQGRFLGRTIASVLGQDYPALEYAVQDGGSTDETAAVLEAHRGSLTSCTSEPDAGQADAINRGFAQIEGEIMAWINSDDLLLPGALAAVARHFATHPETDVVYAQRALIDEEDRQIGNWILPPHDDRTLELVDFIPQETLFWRRRIWEAAGGHVDVEHRYALDWELLLRFRDAGAHFVRLPWVLGGFRVHADQKTTDQIHVGEDEIQRLRAERRGRPVSQEEAWREVRPYLRRHIVHHTLYRLSMRLPGAWSAVDVANSAGPRAR